MDNLTGAVIAGGVVLVAAGGFYLVATAPQRNLAAARGSLSLDDARQRMAIQRQQDLAAAQAIAKRQQESQGNIFQSVLSGVGGLFAGAGQLAQNQQFTGAIAKGVASFGSGSSGTSAPAGAGGAAGGPVSYDPNAGSVDGGAPMMLPTDAVD